MTISRLILIICALVCVQGCLSSNRSEQSTSVETRQGVEGGQPTNLVIRRQEVEQEVARTGVDVQAAVTAAIAGFRGDILGAVDKLKPQPLDPLAAKLDQITAVISKPDEPAFPTGEIATGAAGALAALMAFLKHKEAAKSRAEADEAWDKHTKAVAALPPEEAKKIL